MFCNAKIVDQDHEVDYCVLYKKHSGNCIPRCNKNIEGKWIRECIGGVMFPTQCNFPKNHAGECGDQLGRKKVPTS